MKIRDICLISFLIIFINSNIWDNIYSQIDSPHFEIPENFQISLKNQDDNSSMSEVIFSTELNLIKISLILEESNSKDTFAEILIDFNVGKVYFDTQEKCIYKYYEMLEQFSPKFILKAYDILTYFSKNDNSYSYIITNPFEISLADDKINKLPSILNNIFTNFQKKVLKSKSIKDSDLYAEFIIDIKSELIKSVSLKYQNTLTNFNTVYKSDIDKGKLKGIHNLDECVEYND